MTKQRINLDIDRELWKRVSLRAVEDNMQKREIVEKALNLYLNNKKEN